MEELSPASRAIALLGAKRIAAACDLSTDAVWKWPKQNGGTIPAKHQATVHSLAIAHGVEFTAADIIGVRETTSSAEVAP